MKTAFLRFVSLVFLVSLVSLASCDDALSDSSGVPRTSRVGQLNAADAARLCDWTNQRQGGYGRTVSCAGGDDQVTDSDQKECTDAQVLIAAGCPSLTVADVEDCTNAVQTDLCRYPTAPACAAVRACIGS